MAVHVRSRCCQRIAWCPAVLCIRHLHHTSLFSRCRLQFEEAKWSFEWPEDDDDEEEEEDDDDFDLEGLDDDDSDDDEDSDDEDEIFYELEDGVSSDGVGAVQILRLVEHGVITDATKVWSEALPEWLTWAEAKDMLDLGTPPPPPQRREFTYIITARNACSRNNNESGIFVLVFAGESSSEESVVGSDDENEDEDGGIAVGEELDDDAMLAALADSQEVRVFTKHTAISPM
eukprot:COSAG05_NODE_371_length_10705_cov_99.051475_14_plen_232_part_00